MLTKFNVQEPLNYFSWRFVLMGQLFTTSLHDFGAMLGYWIHVIPCVLLLVFSYLFWARWAWLMLTLGIGLGVGMGFTNITTGDSHSIDGDGISGTMVERRHYGGRETLMVRGTNNQMIVGVAEAVKEQLYQDKISGYPALLRQFTDSTISNERRNLHSGKVVAGRMEPSKIACSV